MDIPAIQQAFLFHKHLTWIFFHSSGSQHYSGLDELRSAVTEWGSSERSVGRRIALHCVSAAVLHRALCLSRQCMRQVCTVLHCLHDRHLALETVDLSLMMVTQGHLNTLLCLSVCWSHLCCHPLNISVTFLVCELIRLLSLCSASTLPYLWGKMMSVVNGRLDVLIGDPAVWVLCFPSAPLLVLCGGFSHPLRAAGKSSGRGMCQRLFGSLTFL